MLLDKIPAEMINIDSGIIGRVDKKTLEEKAEEKLKFNRHMVIYMVFIKLSLAPGNFFSHRNDAIETAYRSISFNTIFMVCRN